MGRLLQVHLVVYLAGALLLVTWAAPVASGDGLGLDSVSWPLLLGPVAVAAALGGLVEGLTFRSRRSALGWPALAVAALLGVAAPLLFVSRWPGEQADTPTDLGLLLAAQIAWAAFAVLLTAVVVAVRRR